MWYHITDSWLEKSVKIWPRVCERPDSEKPRDLVPCIHVCPSIAQCLVAIGEWYDYESLRIYKTRAKADAAPWVFDYQLTKEHRIYGPATFEFVGEVSSAKLRQGGVPLLAMTGSDDAKVIRNGFRVLGAAKAFLKGQFDENLSRV